MMPATRSLAQSAESEYRVRVTDSVSPTWAPDDPRADPRGAWRSGAPRWPTFAIAFALATLALVLWWSFYSPIYSTNDDVQFRLAIAGEDIPGEPASPFLLTVHVALASA